MHASKEVQAVEAKFLRTNLPDFRSGDTIRVHARIKEGGKERIQYVEGMVIRRSGKGATKTFTLRKMSDGIGVELIYPVESANVANIEVMARGDVRRARLFYLRGLTGKAAKVKDLLVSDEVKAKDLKASKEIKEARAIAKASKPKEDAPAKKKK